MKLVRWTADWCKSCGEYASVFDKAVNDWNVPREIVDVDVESDRAAAANISILPTTSVYGDDGTEVYRLVGKRQLTELIDVIKEYKDV